MGNRLRGHLIAGLTVIVASLLAGGMVTQAPAQAASGQQGYVITKAVVVGNVVTMLDSNGDQVATLTGTGDFNGGSPRSATWPEIWHALQQSNFGGDVGSMSNNDSTDPPATGIDPTLLATWQTQANQAMQEWKGDYVSIGFPKVFTGNTAGQQVRDADGQLITLTPPDQTSILEFENLIHDADVMDKNTNGWTGAIEPLQPNAPNPVTPPGGDANPNTTIGQSPAPVQPPVTSLPPLQTVSPKQQEHQILAQSAPRPGQTAPPTPAKVTPPVTDVPVKVTTPVNREADKGYYEATHTAPAAKRYWAAEHKPVKKTGRGIGWLLALIVGGLLVGFVIERTIRYRRNKTQYGW